MGDRWSATQFPVDNLALYKIRG